MRIAAAVEDRNDALRLMGERGAGAASRRYCLNCSNSLPSFSIPPSNPTLSHELIAGVTLLSIA